VLCPGRYFASTEILGVVATLITGFEISSAYGVALNVPACESQKMSVQVKHPVGDLDVNLARREGWEGVSWGYEFVGGGKVMREGEGVFG
jgi:2-methylaconitate cis-trans-isomerase PrpF